MNNNKDCAIASGKLLNEDGTLQYSCRRFPTFFNVFFGRETFFTKFAPNNRFTRNYMYAELDYEKDNDVEWVRGAVMLVRRDIFERLNGFDESFFLFLEDTDLCMRVRKEGFRVCYVSDAVFYHKLGVTISLYPLRSKIIHNYSFRNYFKKYTKNIILKVIIDYGFLFRFSFVIFYNFFERIFI